jgi:hypothetical protein
MAFLFLFQIMQFFFYICFDCFWFMLSKEHRVKKLHFFLKQTIWKKKGIILAIQFVSMQFKLLFFL